MSNTLKSDTPEELTSALVSYNSHICDIPDGFTVLDEYLNGLDAKEFRKAFGQLCEFVRGVYGEITDDPASVGLLGYDKKTGEPKVLSSQHISCVKKLLYALGRFSVIDGDLLKADSDSFFDAYITYYSNTSTELSSVIKEQTPLKRERFIKSKNVDKVFALLSRHGLEIKCDGGRIIAGCPDNRALTAVIKAFSQPRICRECFGFDYAKFNYRVFAYPSDAVLPLGEQYSFNLLCKEHRAFLAELDGELNKAGASFGSCAGGWYSGTLPCQYNYKNKVRILQNIESGLLPHVVMRFGKKAGRMAEFIDSLPEKYRSCIVTCKGCRKGECDHRIPVAAAGKRYVLCNVAWWYFPPETEAIPYIVKAYGIC
nr:hypothetical protein [Clostridia bacterium]